MKKLNKLFAILVAMAMVLSLGVVSAFAADGDKQNTTGTAVEKVLTVPKDVVPAGTLKIKATLATIDNQAPASEQVIEKTINLNAPVKTDKSDAATDVYYYGTENLLKDVTFPAGGQYVYNITEDTAGVTNEGLVNDTNTYVMTVNVGADKTVKSVYVKTDENKKDLYDTITETNATAVADNGVAFKNNIKEERPGTSFEDTAFGIKKTVKADGQGVADQTTPFEFTITVKLPTNNAYAEYYENGVKKTIETDEEQTLTVKLAHGQEMYFSKLPVGALVSAEETDARANGENASYTKKGDEATKNKTTITKDNAVKADVENEHKKTDATGILMSNLPYIVLALVAIGGMVAYVVVRRRNADEA